MGGAPNGWGETPEEIAEAISMALGYLRREADAVDGMGDVSALIQHACDAARAWVPAQAAATDDQPVDNGARRRPAR